MAANPYLSRTMNRVLLTLLALLTGFAAQVSPAQAAVRGGCEAEIGSVHTVRAAVRLARQAAVASTRANVAYDGRLRDSAPLAYCATVAPSVHIGIDRARE